MIDTVNRTTVATIQLDEQPVSLDVTPRGKRVYVVDDTTNLIHVIDATNNTGAGADRLRADSIRSPSLCRQMARPGGPGYGV